MLNCLKHLERAGKGRGKIVGFLTIISLLESLCLFVGLQMD